MADVTIYGAGVIGLTLAWECLKRGATVQVIDPYGVAAGSSGGVVGALAPHVPENWNAKKAFQLDSLLMARSLWPEIEEVSGLSTGYVRSGRVQPLADARAVELARGREESAKELWADHAEWHVQDAARHHQWLNHSATDLVVYDTLSAHIHPRRGLTALAAAIRARGGRIEPTAEPSGQVVHCTGWQGLLDLSADMGRSVGTGVKGQAALFQCDAGSVPQLFVDSLHIIPHNDGTVAIGSTTERDFHSPTDTDASLEALIAKARGLVPMLAGADVVARWAGVRPRAKSRAPVMGHWPGKGGHFVSNGGFKIGFGMAPKMAQVMADLVLEGQDVIPDDFRL